MIDLHRLADLVDRRADCKPLPWNTCVNCGEQFQKAWSRPGKTPKFCSCYCKGEHDSKTWRGRRTR